MDKKTLYILDGYGFIFRAYHVQPPLKDPHGNPVGAIYGLTSMLLKLINDFKPEYFCVALDSKGKNFRHEIYNEYKAHRPDIDEDLKKQLPLIPNVLKSFNIKQIAQEGFEADDIIAYLTDKAEKENFKAVIISSDKDLTQLINDNVKMFDHLKNKMIDRKSVQERYGVEPSLMRDYLSLIGDKSDNIPGVPGIGPKNALDLLNEFGSLEKICQSTHLMKAGKRKDVIENSQDLIKLSWNLIGLNKNIGTEFEMTEFQYHGPNHEMIGSFINDHGFYSLKDRTESLFSIKIQNKKENIKTIEITQINSKEQLEQIAQMIQKSGIVAILIHDIDIDKKSIELSFDNKSSYFLEIDLKDPDKLDIFDFSNKEEKNWWTDHISKIFQDNSILKITYDAKFLIKELNNALKIISFKAIEDIMLMEYIIAGIHDKNQLKEIIKKYNDQNSKADDQYIAHFMINTYFQLKTELLNNKALELYYNIDLPLVKILYDMEKAGIKINAQYLLTLSKDFENQIENLTKEIFKITNKEFNIASSKQLGEILFDHLQIKGGKKLSKSGSYGTGAEILESLSEEGHQIADYLLEWRKFTKLKNTYTDSLGKLALPLSNRIHTTFLQCTTSTGRLSSHNPNLQNIPIRTIEGNKIRKAFISEKSHQLISADYSQIELRILSHIADIQVLQNAFEYGVDIHSLTASQIFKVKLEDVTPDIRRKAKAINFGIIYGISAFGLAKNISISRKEAQDYIDYYFKEYPGIKQYMDETIEYATNHGFVTNIFGRKSFIPLINSSQAQMRNFAQRAAINAPIQSTASDIAKKAMIGVSEIIRSKKYQTKMLLQIHDELIFESPIEEISDFSKDIKNIMENVVKLKISLKVDIKAGINWQEMENLKL